jgi:UDP-glucose 4-epimerase
VQANLLAARSAKPLRGDVMNVACGKRVTLNQLAKTMADALARPDLTPIHQKPRAGDVKHSLADLSHAKKMIDYDPIVDFPTGLRATIEWYRNGAPAPEAPRPASRRPATPPPMW